MKEYIEFPQKTKNRTAIWSSYTSPAYIPKANIVYTRHIKTPIFFVALLTIAKVWNQLEIYQQMNE
jgi:hypothetical protein